MRRRLVLAATLAALSTITTTGAYAGPAVESAQVTYLGGDMEFLQTCVPGRVGCGVSIRVLPGDRYLNLTIEQLVGTGGRIGAWVYTAHGPVHICGDTASGPLDITGLDAIDRDPSYGFVVIAAMVEDGAECGSPLSVTVQGRVTAYFSKQPVSLADAIATATPSDPTVREAFAPPLLDTVY